MEVNQLIKLIRATSRSKKRPSASKKKSWFDSFEERFWVILIFCCGSVYLFFWIVGKDDLIHREINIFCEAHAKNFPQLALSPKTRTIQTTKRIPQLSINKSKYQKFADSKEFKIDFDQLIVLETDFGVKDFTFSYKELENYVAQLTKQREIIEKHRQQLAADLNHNNFNSKAYEFYNEIIKRDFELYCTVLINKIKGKLGQYREEIKLLRQIKQQQGGIGSEASRLLSIKSITFKQVQQEFIRILQDLSAKIESIPDYPIAIDNSSKTKQTIIISENLEALDTFFKEFYDL